MTGANVLARSVPFVAIMSAAAYFYYLADHLEFDPMPGRAGPDLWPKIVLGLMIATCAIGIVKAFLARSSEGANLFKLLAPQAEEEQDGRRSWPHLALLGCALFVVYVLALDRVGFPISTAVLIAAFLWIGRYRNGTVIALGSLVGSLGFFFVFRKIVYVSLPLGREPFLAFSVWLMKLMGMS
ncbi:MAG TPA: tripartite tricarboxylate transporter TctB family protein [Alphaproteobacteria bacterium]|nr:tripartite tricarboxylate transporter TctB family protein [Alphaproteobacteria bacterium]